MNNVTLVVLFIFWRHVICPLESLLNVIFYRNQVDSNSEKFTGVIAKVECVLGEVLSHGGSLELPLFPNKGTLDEVKFF